MSKAVRWRTPQLRPKAQDQRPNPQNVEIRRSVEQLRNSPVRTSPCPEAVSLSPSRAPVCSPRKKINAKKCPENRRENHFPYPPILTDPKKTRRFLIGCFGKIHGLSPHSRPDRRRQPSKNTGARTAGLPARPENVENLRTHAKNFPAPRKPAACDVQ